MHTRQYKHPRFHWFVTIFIGFGMGVVCFETMKNLGEELRNSAIKEELNKQKICNCCQVQQCNNHQN